MLKAVLFDLDGTLLDTLPDLCACMNEALEKFGYPPITIEQTKKYVGNGGRLFAERSLPESARARTDEFYAEYCKIHVSCGNLRTKLYPFEEECLSALRSCGIRLAVVTNKSQAAADVLKDTLLKPFAFDAVLGNRVGLPVKPDPAGALLVLKELGADPSEAAFVGDGETDVQTAKNAGMRSVSVLWGYRSRQELAEAGAERFATDYRQLAEILLSMR